MSTQRVAGIVPGDESEINDEPHVSDSRITVRYLQRQVEVRGLEPREVADRHGLAVADVYAALTYYYRNPEQMDRVEDRRADRAAEAVDRTTLTPPDDR
jgi:uncharacterized protein (DUF433 family)